MSQSQLTAFDQKLLESAQLSVEPALGTAYKIDFQFPPKIVSEANSALWKPFATMGAQPVSIHEGSSGRAVQIEWEYIATDNVFTPEKISKMLQTLKAYFFEFNFGAQGEWMPVLVFKYSGIIPDKITFRVENISITYSPEIIMQNNIFFPFCSKVSASLMMVTAGGGKGGQPAVMEFAQNLRREPKPEWY